MFRSRPQQKLGRSARPAASARSARPAASARGDRRARPAASARADRRALPSRSTESNRSGTLSAGELEKQVSLHCLSPDHARDDN